MQTNQATLAARRYFLDGWTIKDIAAELGVSRFKVARLIEWARAEGLVRIEIVETVRSDIELSAELRSAFGLRDALVVAGLDGRSNAIAPELAELAALAVAEVVTSSDVVGISWGRTLDLLVEHLADFSAKRVVQLIGGLATLESASGGIELVRQLAAKANTRGYPLLAPVRPQSAAVAEALRRDPIVAGTLKLIEDVTVVLAGVGSWGDPPVSRMIECFNETELSALRERGVVADLCGFLFTKEGEVLRSLENERIGITREQLDAAETVLAIAGGTEKHQALAAVLRSRMVDILITDAGSAKQLLRD
jgi:DNA-binding transcriptional regulator LsrR (DeoR family)